MAVATAAPKPTAIALTTLADSAPARNIGVSSRYLAFQRPESLIRMTVLRYAAAEPVCLLRCVFGRVPAGLNPHWADLYVHVVTSVSPKPVALQ